ARFDRRPAPGGRRPGENRFGYRREPMRACFELGDARRYLNTMKYIALANDRELELADESAVANALRRGVISPETWIKIEDVESDWETVAEMFPELNEGRQE